MAPQRKDPSGLGGGTISQAAAMGNGAQHDAAQRLGLAAALARASTQGGVPAAVPQPPASQPRAQGMLRMGVRSNSASASHKLVWANGSPSTVAFNQGGVHGSAYLNSARDTRTPSANRQRSPSPAHGGIVGGGFRVTSANTRAAASPRTSINSNGAVAGTSPLQRPGSSGAGTLYSDQRTAAASSQPVYSHLAIGQMYMSHASGTTQAAPAGARGAGAPGGQHAFMASGTALRPASSGGTGAGASAFVRPATSTGGVRPASSSMVGGGPKQSITAGVPLRPHSSGSPNHVRVPAQGHATHAASNHAAHAAAPAPHVVTAWGQAPAHASHTSYQQQGHVEYEEGTRVANAWGATPPHISVQGSGDSGAPVAGGGTRSPPSPASPAHGVTPASHQRNNFRLGRYGLHMSTAPPPHTPPSGIAGQTAGGLAAANTGSDSAGLGQGGSEEGSFGSGGEHDQHPASLPGAGAGSNSLNNSLSSNGRPLSGGGAGVNPSGLPPPSPTKHHNAGASGASGVGPRGGGSHSSAPQSSSTRAGVTRGPQEVSTSHMSLLTQLEQTYAAQAAAAAAGGSSPAPVQDGAGTRSSNTGWSDSGSGGQPGQPMLIRRTSLSLAQQGGVPGPGSGSTHPPPIAMTWSGPPAAGGASGAAAGVGATAGHTTPQARTDGRLPMTGGSVPAPTGQHNPHVAGAAAGPGSTTATTGTTSAASASAAAMQRRNSTGSLSGQFLEPGAGWGVGAGGGGGHSILSGSPQVTPSRGGAHLGTPSSSRLAEGFGTLTALRQSTNESGFAAAFAAESQNDVPAGMQSSASTVGGTTTGPGGTHSHGYVREGGSGSGAAGGAGAASVPSRQGSLGMTGGGSSAAAASVISQGSLGSTGGIPPAAADYLHPQQGAAVGGGAAGEEPVSPALPGTAAAQHYQQSHYHQQQQGAVQHSTTTYGAPHSAGSQPHYQQQQRALTDHHIQASSSGSLHSHQSGGDRPGPSNTPSSSVKDRPGAQAQPTGAPYAAGSSARERKSSEEYGGPVLNSMVPSYLRKSSAPDAATPTRPVQEGYQTQPSSSMPAQGGVPPSPAWDAATQPQQPSLHNSSVAMAAAAAAAAATAAAAAASAAAAAARAQAQAGAPMTPQALLAASFTKTSAGAASGIAAGSQATGLTGRAGEVDAAAKAGTRPAVEPGTNHAAVPSSFSRPVTPSTGAAAAVVSSQSAAAPPAISFSSVASPPVPVTNAPVAKLLMAPGGAPGEQIMSMLGGEMHADHSAALPGYSVGKIIGEGGFCQVRLAVHHLSGRRVAVKIIDKSKLTDPNEAKRIQREIRVMRHLTHECIIKLFEVVDAPAYLYLVMEHAPNGSLLDYVRSRKRLAEGDAAFILQQVMAGLEYCHRREVVHRDVKLENILLDSDNVMKVIDFGLSAFFVPGKRLRVHCGSPSYAAPEIVARKQYDGPPVDVWSLGVVLFAMLAGYLPFHSSSGKKDELCAKIMEGRYTAPDALSPLAKDVVARMLTVDPDRRITFEQLWGHPWVRGASRWEPIGASIYQVTTDPSSGAVYADEQLIVELEAAGYSRQMVLQNLLHAEVNYMTAAYFLLAEGKAELIRRMRGPAASRRYMARANTAPASAPGQGRPGHAAVTGGHTTTTSASSHHHHHHHYSSTSSHHNEGPPVTTPGRHSAASGGTPSSRPGTSGGHTYGAAAAQQAAMQRYGSAWTSSSPRDSGSATHASGYGSRGAASASITKHSAGAAGAAGNMYGGTRAGQHAAWVQQAEGYVRPTTVHAVSRASYGSKDGHGHGQPPGSPAGAPHQRVMVS